MERTERGCERSTTLTALALLLLLLGLPLAMPWAPAEDLTVTTFSGDGPVVDVTFREEAGNASNAIELPKGCTVLSAEMDIEGVRMRGDDVRTLDLSDFDPPTTAHRAWRGWVQGNYPPSYPFWDPSSPRGTAFNSSNYDDVGTSDDVRLRTVTGQQTTNRYPFHLFRFMVPVGTLTGLEVGWEGYGYCLADTGLPRGAEMFVWRNASSAWDRVDWYGKNEAAIDRTLTKSCWARSPRTSLDQTRGRPRGSSRPTTSS